MNGDWVLDRVKVDMEYRQQQVLGRDQAHRAISGNKVFSWDKVFAKIAGKGKNDNHAVPAQLKSSRS